MTRDANKHKVLAALPGSAAQVIERTGLGLATVSRWLTHLRKHKEIYLHHKEIHEHGGPLISVYHPGPRPQDHKVRSPRIPTDAERTRQHRKRLRATGDWEDVKAKRRSTYYLNKPPRRDPLTAAFFGEYK